MKLVVKANAFVIHFSVQVQLNPRGGGLIYFNLKWKFVITFRG